MQVWVKSLVDGSEAPVIADQEYSRWIPGWSPEGTRLAYERRNLKTNERQLMVWSRKTHDEEPIAAPNALGGPYDWSPDGKWLLDATGNGILLAPVAAAPHAETAIRRIPYDGSEYFVYQTRLSPDGRWIVFEAVAISAKLESALYVIPVAVGTWSPAAANMVHEDDARKLTLNLVVEIPRDEPAGIEDGDRRLRHSSRAGQLPDERRDQMGRRVETVDRSMIRCVIQVRLDRDLLAGLVSSLATTISAIEILKHCAPCVGIAFLICKTADGAGDHAVNHNLVVVSVRPPGTCSIPGHCCWIVCPGDSAGNHAARNTQWGKRGFE
jgi:hypothetical protein